MKLRLRENFTGLNTNYYNWKAKYGGMAVSDVKRLRQLETAALPTFQWHY
jgi:hypothetical protein